MASEHSLHVIEVRTYLVDGVGSGGDYHNVGCSETPDGSILAEMFRSKEGIGS